MEITREQNVSSFCVVPLIDSANRPDYKSSPTLAAGDVKVIRHTAGSWNVANIGTLPSVIAGATTQVLVTLTATELNPDDNKYPIIIQFIDADGAEWDDQTILIWARPVVSNVTEIDSDDQSATDLKDFADAGYDPATNKVEGVKLVDTTTTNTDLVAHDTKLDTVDTVVDAIKSVTDILPNSGALTDIDTGINNIEAKLPTNYIMGSSVQTNKDDEIDAIKAKTDNLPSDPASETNVNANETKIDAIQSTVDAIETDTQDLQTQIGIAGAGLTDLGGMSIGMKAEVEAEATDALNVYDPPTKTEMDNGFAALNDLSAAEVNTEVDTALSDMRLDELMSAALGSQPAVGSLFGDLTEDDVGTQRFNANALEEAPSGTGGDATAANQTTIITHLTDVKGTGFVKDTDSMVDLTHQAGTKGSDNIHDDIAALNDLSAAEVNTEVDTALADYDGPTKTELDSGFAALNNLSAADVNAEVDTALADINLDHLLAVADVDDVVDNSVIAKLASKGAIADWSTFVNTTDALEAVADSITALNNLSAADVNAEVDTALADYDGPTNTEMNAAFAALNDLSAADVNAECDTALTDYDGPTNTEMNAGFAALNDLDSAGIQAACDTAITANTDINNIDSGVNNIEAKLPTKAAIAGSDNVSGDIELDDATGSLPAGAFTNHPEVALEDDAITSAKFDETTAFPIVSADSGNSQIARTGADADTLKTLSDEIVAVQTSVDGIQNNTKFVATVPQHMLIPSAGDNMYKLMVHFYDSDGNMEDPDNSEINVLFEDVSGADKDAFFDDAAGLTGATAGTIDVNMWQMAKISTGVYETYYKLPNTETVDQWTATFKLEESAALLHYARTTNVVDETPGSTTLADNTTNADIIAEALKERNVSGTSPVAGSIYQDIMDNIDANGTAIAGLNDISAAEVNAECDTALTDYDGPTNTEMLASFSGLNDISAAEVNTEVDTALADYDGPTKLELDSGFAALNNVSSADVNAACDTALTDYDGPTNTEMNSAFAALNDLSAADVNAEVDTALSDIRLDELISIALVSQPTVGSIIGDLTEDDAGTQRFNINALEQGPVANASDVAGATVNVTEIEGADATTQLIAAVDASIETYGLDHLVAVSVTGADVADGSIIADIVSKSATPDYDSYDNTTDSLEALADASGSGLSAQEVRDAMKLAPTVGAPAVGSIDEHLDDILADTNETQSKLPTNNIMGSSVKTDKDDEIDSIKTTVEGLNNISTSEVNAEVDTALSDIRLDELMSLSIGSQPASGSMFGDLTEDDGGTQRFTSNALEEAPTGGTDPFVLNSTTIASVTDQTHFVLTDGSNDDDAYKDQSVVVYDASNNDNPSVRVATGYIGSTKTITIDADPDFTIIAGDSIKIFVTAPGSTAPTAGQVADAVWDEALSGHVAAGSAGQNQNRIDEIDTGVDAIEAKLPTGSISDFDESVNQVIIATNNDKTGYSISGAKTTLDALNDVSAAQVNAECDTALTDYDPPTNTEMLASFALLNDISSADVNAACDTALSDYDGPTNTEMTAAFATLNDISTADVNAEVDSALVDIGLDHLVSAAVIGTDIVDDSIIAQLASKSATADWDSFDNTTDSLEAIADSSETGISSQQVRDAMLLAPTGGAPAAGSIDEHLDDILTDTNEIQGKLPIGNISEFDSSSDQVTVATNNDKTGYSISGIKNTLDDLNDVSAAEVNTEVDTALTDYDGPTNTEMAAAFAALNDLSAADINAEVDTALIDIGLDHLVSASVTGTDVTDDSIIAQLVSKAATADYDTFDNTTDSLEAIADSSATGISSQQVRDAMLLAPTGGAPAAGSVDEHLDDILADTNEIQGKLPTGDISEFDSSSDQVIVSTNNDKTGYSISGTKQTLDNLNDLSAAEVNAECDTALTDYDGPTNTEMTAAFASLNDLSAADVNAEVDTALSDIGLDHLVSAAVSGTDVADDSVIAKLVSKEATADYDTFNNTTDSLEAIADSSATGISSQQVRDAMLLAPTPGTPAVDSIDEHLDDLVTAIGTPIALDSGIASIAGMLTKMADNNDGADFDASTDSLSELTVGSGTADWSSVEKEQIRDALGVDGNKTAATGGQLQTVDTVVDGIMTELDSAVYGLSAIKASVDAVDVGDLLDATLDGTATVGIGLKKMLAYCTGNMVRVAQVYTYRNFDDDADEMVLTVGGGTPATTRTRA